MMYIFFISYHIILVVYPYTQFVSKSYIPVIYRHILHLQKKLTH